MPTAPHLIINSSQQKDPSNKVERDVARNVYLKQFPGDGVLEQYLSGGVVEQYLSDGVLKQYLSGGVLITVPE